MEGDYQMTQCDFGKKALAGMHGFAPVPHVSTRISYQESQPAAIPKHVKVYLNLKINR